MRFGLGVEWAWGSESLGWVGEGRMWETGVGERDGVGREGMEGVKEFVEYLRHSYLAVRRRCQMRCARSTSVR